MQSLLKDLFSIFSIKNNPTISRKGKGFLIQSAFDYSCESFFDDNYMYFKHKDYYFCVKRKNKQSSLIKELGSFLEYSSLFNLSYESFIKIISRCAFTPDWDDYSRCIEFNESRFNLLDIKTKKITSLVKKIAIFDLTLFSNRSYKKINGFIFADTFFELSDYSSYFGSGDFSRNSEYDDRIQMFKYNSCMFGERSYSYNYNLRKRVYSAQKKVDFNSLKLIGSYSEHCIPIKLNGTLALFGVKNNTWFGNRETLIDFNDFYRKNIKKFKTNKSDFNFIKKYFIDKESTSVHFVCYVPQKNNTLKVYKIKATDEALLCFENLLIDKIDNEKNFYKHPSSHVKYSLENMGIIEKHAEPTKEELDLYKMMEI